VITGYDHVQVAIPRAGEEAVRDVLESGGHPCVDASGEIEGIRRFHAFDPFGNRLDFQQA
jgi:hypothetical protein